jgi:hypothetical protein
MSWCYQRDAQRLELDTELGGRICTVTGSFGAMSGKPEKNSIRAGATNRCV